MAPVELGMDGGHLSVMHKGFSDGECAIRKPSSNSPSVLSARWHANKFHSLRPVTTNGDASGSLGIILRGAQIA